MKKSYLLTSLFVVLSVFSYAQSDQQVSNSELTITQDGKRLEATIVCLDALEAPTKYNEFAKQFTSMPNFPKNSSAITNAQLRSSIDTWFKNNPTVIDQVRSEQKKAHDILYGPRPQ